VASIDLIDQSMRDGQQSLWGMRMRAGHCLPVASEIDRVGYRVVDFTGSSLFEVLVRFCRENPWDGLDLVRAAMPTATLRAGTRSAAIVGMGLTPDSILELWVRTLAKHGIGSLWVFDCLFDMPQMMKICDVAHDAGLKVAPQVMFGESPVHTDAYFADKIAQMASWDCVDSIILGDESGALSAERADSFIAASKAAAGTVPLELHFHNTTGISTFNYLTGVKHGVRILHTAVGPMANGPSMPSAEVTIDNLRRLGHDVNIDDEPLPRIARHFRRVAEAEGYEVGVPREYNVSASQHQLPGGMTGTLMNQLRQYGMEHRLGEVLDEIAVVRAEMGYPIMATPYSQLVGIQALLNIVNGQRYSVFPDENLMYLGGHMGPIAGEVDQNVMDRAFSTQRGKEFLDWQPPQPSLKEVRAKIGENLSDEELLLRFLMPGPDVDAMLAAGPVRTRLAYPDSPESTLVRDLMSRTASSYLAYDDGRVSVQMRRAANPG